MCMCASACEHVSARINVHMSVWHVHVRACVKCVYAHVTMCVREPMHQCVQAFICSVCEKATCMNVYAHACRLMSLRVHVHGCV